MESATHSFVKLQTDIREWRVFFSSTNCKRTRECRVFSSTNSPTNLDDLPLYPLYPLFHRTVDLTPFYSRETTCLVEVIADGSCGPVNNHMGCGFDGGDCCSHATILREDDLPWCEEDEQTVVVSDSAGSCPASCYGTTCDGWYPDYPCSVLEAVYNCDCAGCNCGETPVPTPFEALAPTEAPECEPRVDTKCYDAAKFGLEVGSSNADVARGDCLPSPPRVTDIVRGRSGIYS